MVEKCDPDPANATEAVLPPDTLIGEVDDVPYSIYTRKEKWVIVGMVALAGFYRSVSLDFSSFGALCGTFGTTYTD